MKYSFKEFMWNLFNFDIFFPEFTVKFKSSNVHKCINILKATNLTHKKEGLQSSIIFNVTCIHYIWALKGETHVVQNPKCYRMVALG